MATAADPQDVAVVGARYPDAIVATTEWPEHAAIDWTAVAPLMRRRLVIDTSRVVDPGRAAGAGVSLIFDELPIAPSA